MARRKTPAAGAPQGALHPRSIFSVDDVGIIHSLHAEGWSQREIAERMTEILAERGDRDRRDAVRRQTISKVLRGERHADD